MFLGIAPRLTSVEDLHLSVFMLFRAQFFGG